MLAHTGNVTSNDFLLNTQDCAVIGEYVSGILSVCG